MNQFLTNYTEIKFLDKIKEELSKCNSFNFSVSFIKKAGLILIKKDIEAAVERGVKGRIITSTYQNFTDIESLKFFLDLQDRYKNFECHLDYDCFVDESYRTLGYHSKGYLFNFANRKETIIGSSNITRYALLKNIEWDVMTEDGSVYDEAMTEFEEKWDKTHSLNRDIIALYSNKLNFAIERWDMDYDLSIAKIKPNYMQRQALKELNRFRSMGISRALIVAAAGSGKTYLAAFDALNFNPKKLLYIVHEGSILRKSLETFQEVFGSSINYGIYDGNNKDIDADFLFSTNVTMSKNLELFDSNHFDFIIIDEAHHITAETYQNIIKYFQPEFLLGLTATPERMDNKDVFEIFEKNVPYELRLRDAIINGLVVPFKYYGIRDQLIDYGLSKSDERKLVAQLATVEHCDYIANEIEAHRPVGKLKAIAFCRNVNHARMMSETMGERYKTAYLTGSNSIGERIRAYNDLQDDNSELEILFSVDILNEGVDIPGINMVLFLRPTESSTVFIQQLGRGLRKFENKAYVTVLDFIGNSYKRSVQIACALGSLAENFILEKKLLLSLLKNDFSALGLEEYGVEINIDDLSKEEIEEYIENENFNSLNYTKQDYYNFKKYINEENYPKHIDYFNNDCAPDLLKFMSISINNRKTKSYYNFLQGIQEENVPIFNELQIKFIDYLSSMLPLVRDTEYLFYQKLIEGDASKFDLIDYVREMSDHFSDEEMEHAIKYVIESNYVRQSSDVFSLCVNIDSQIKEYLLDLITYGLTRYKAEYMNNEQFRLWGAYRKDQVQLKLLKNPKDYMMGTYYYDNVVYIFAGLKKDANVSEKLAYMDKYIDEKTFQWESVNNISQSEIDKLRKSDHAELFIRKVESEHGIQQPFIYCGKGKMREIPWPGDYANVRGSLLFHIDMDIPLPDYLQFDFEVENSKRD